MTTAQRVPAVSEVPTIADSGVPGTKGFDSSIWFGVFAPKGTDARVVGRLNSALRTVLETPRSRHGWNPQAMPCAWSPRAVQGYRARQPPEVGRGGEGGQYLHRVGCPKPQGRMVRRFAQGAPGRGSAIKREVAGRGICSGRKAREGG